MFDGKEFGEEIVGIVRKFVEREVGPLKAENEAMKAQIAALEAREPLKGDPGEPGQDGVSADAEAIVTAFAPTAETMIAEAAAKAVANLPPPEKGEKGDAGEAGQDGAPGEPGQPGKDGLGVRGALIDRAGHLRITMEDGTDHDLGMVCGRDGDDGKRGKDGRDGFSLEDFDACVLDDDRTLQLSFKSGEHEHIATLKWPTAIYRGVFSDGRQYDQGDMVTWGGSLWHCDAETKDKPGTENWTLAAKKGRDGKDARKDTP